MSVQDEDNQNSNDSDNNQSANDNQGDSEKNSQHNNVDNDTSNSDNDDDTQESKDSGRHNPDGNDQGKDDEDDETPPPTRKSKLQYIQERQEKARLKREQQYQGNQKKIEKDNDFESDDEEDSDNLSDDEKKIYNKMERVFLKKHGDKFQQVDKVIESNEHNEVNSEITTFLKNDEYGDLIAEHEKTLRKYAMHPSRRAVPIDEIMYGIAGKKLIAYGAEMARKAMKEAQKSRNASGSSNRRVEGIQSKSSLEMTDEEFRAEQRRVLQGRK